VFGRWTVIGGMQPVTVGVDHVPEDDVLDPVWLDARAPDGLADDHCPELRRR